MRADLSKFPKLERWYQKNQHRVTLLSAEEKIVLAIFHFLHSSSDRFLLDHLFQTMQQLFCHNPAPEKLYLKLEELLGSCDIVFSEILAEVVHSGIIIGSGESMLKSMSNLADQTKLVAFRFLAAWSALNIEDFECCIKECEKVDQPFAPIFTIQGQAFIELGQFTEAIESLHIAVELSPLEILAWFQLAKAYHLANSDKCWDALCACNRLAPSNVEVAAFMAISALADDPVDGNKCLLAFNALAPHLEKSADNAAIRMHLFRLSLYTENKSDALMLAKELGTQKIYLQKDFVGFLPRILKRLQMLQWFDVSYDLLSNIDRNPTTDI